MARLHGFDYARPFFYMVTLKKRKGWPAFSEVIGDPSVHYLRKHAITDRFIQVIRSFHLRWRCIQPIECFTIMPDHLHLLIKIRNVTPRVTLPRLVFCLELELERALLALCPEDYPTHLFEADWHDWIVKEKEQLTAFTHYIRANPARLWRRISHQSFFQKVHTVEFLGRMWFAYGNDALLRQPVIVPFQCSRRWQEGDESWQRACMLAERLGPGCAGISTFMSPCEKVCGRAIGHAGGAWIVLSPEGFGERWHPSERMERFCAQGRMLFLSLYPAVARQPTKKELYDRCHEMGDVVMRALEGKGQ